MEFGYHGHRDGGGGPAAFQPEPPEGDIPHPVEAGPHARRSRQLESRDAGLHTLLLQEGPERAERLGATDGPSVRDAGGHRIAKDARRFRELRIREERVRAGGGNVRDAVAGAACVGELHGTDEESAGVGQEPARCGIRGGTRTGTRRRGCQSI